SLPAPPWLAMTSDNHAPANERLDGFFGGRWSMGRHDKAKERAHSFLVIMSLSTVFLFSGTVFGWGAFSSMLLQEGYYDYLCVTPDKDHPCEKQLQALNNAFTLATTFVPWRSRVSLTAFVNGWLVDTLGPTKVTIISGGLEIGVMNCLGLMGIALTKALPWSHHEAAEGGFDLFLWSLLLVAVGGSMTMCPERFKDRPLGFIGYQAPFLIPSHFTLLIEAWQIPEVNSCLFDAGTIIFPVLKLLYDVGVPFSFSLLTVAWALNGRELDGIRQAAGGAEANGNDGNAQRHRPLEQRGMLQQLVSWEFAAIFIYSIIQVPRANMYMGSVELINRHWVLAGAKGLAKVAGVSTITGFIIPFGFLAVPLIELCVHRLGTIPTVQVTTLLGLLYNAPWLYLQLGTVCVFAAWRAFLYSTISAFNGEIFGVKTMGRIMGLCFVFSGLTNMLTGPIVNAAVDSNNFVPLLVEGMCFCIPLPIIFQLLHMKRSRLAVDVARTPLASSVRGFPIIFQNQKTVQSHGGYLGAKDILDPMGAMSITRARSSTWPSEAIEEEISRGATSLAEIQP
ncbi:unnamed protein product, partial [Cladocopium goreaui]